MAEFTNHTAGSTAIIDISNYIPGEYIVTKKDSRNRIRTEKLVKL